MKALCSIIIGGTETLRKTQNYEFQKWSQRFGLYDLVIGGKFLFVSFCDISISGKAVDFPFTATTLKSAK